MESTMAWTDSCKLAAKETIDNIVKKKDVTKKAAIKQVSEAAGIPMKTLDRWYYPKKANLKNEVNKKITANPVTGVVTRFKNIIGKTKKKEELEDLRTKLEVLIKEVETKING